MEIRKPSVPQFRAKRAQNVYAPFLRRVLLDGSFGIDDAQFKQRTQDKMEKLSSRARGQDNVRSQASVEPNTTIQVGVMDIRTAIARSCLGRQQEMTVEQIGYRFSQPGGCSLLGSP